MYINWLNWMIFIHNYICYTKNGGKENFPDYLNVMVDYHYHGENKGNYPVSPIYGRQQW